VAAAVTLARENGLRVDEPAVLAELFSVMVHLRPAPVEARVSTWTSKLHTPIADWLAREIAMTTFLSEQGAPVVAPSRGAARFDGGEPRARAEPRTAQITEPEHDAYQLPTVA
jgi:hypothetical protein